MTNMTPPPPTVTKGYKAYAAFFLTFLGALLASVQGRPEVDTLKVIDWLIIFGSAIVTAGSVYGITNPPTGRRH